MLLFCDSFDHYQTPQLDWKYLSASTYATIQPSGRTGTNCLNLSYSGSVVKAFQNTANFIVGLAFNPANASDGLDFLNFIDNGVVQGTLALTSMGGISYSTYPGGGNRVVVATSENNIISSNTYSYIEINVVFQTTATGSVMAQVNGNQVFSVSSIITSATLDNYANTISLFNFNGSQLLLIDDLYVCDGTGGVNNSFLGDVSVEALFPTNDGSVNQWTPSQSGVQNWTLVRNNPPNTADYVYSSTPGDTDSYTFTNIASGVTVVAMQIVAAAEKDDSNTRLLQVGFGNGSTFAFGGNFSLTNSYIMYPQPFDVDPITTNPWTVANVNSGQLAIIVAE